MIFLLKIEKENQYIYFYKTYYYNKMEEEEENKKERMKCTGKAK